MRPSPREELLRLQQRLFRRNQELIAQSVVVHESGFRQYEQRYRRAVARYTRVVSYDHFLRAVRRADLVYVGDYHTCAQSQRSFLRLLRALVTDPRPCAIGLELIHRRKQAIVDAYLRDEISEAQFLKAVGLQRHWVFDLWENFRPLFDFAKFHHIPIFGIDAADSGASLPTRDRATGQYLAQLSAQHPTHRLLTLIGDLHLAPQHLPRETQQALAARQLERQDLMVYQNSEAIYWQLATLGHEHRANVVQIDPRSYCRMHTPPVVCQQSYLNWLEHEEGEIDFADAKHQFLEIVDQIAGFLRLDLGPERDQITVYTCGDLSFLEVLRRRKDFSPKQLAVIRRHVLMSESYFLPRQRMVYLANLSLNHAAEEAAHFIKYLLSGPESPRPYVDAFYANVLHEALGFFGSKLINHHRKCFHEAEFRQLRRYFATLKTIPPARVIEDETARLVLNYRRAEGRRRPLAYSEIFYQDPDVFFATTHALGYMLGDRMFYGVMGKRLGKAAVRNLFRDPWPREGEVFHVYKQLHEKLRAVAIPKRV